LQEFEERLRKKQQRAARKKQEKSRAEKNSLKRVSLTDAVVRENPELLESQVGVDDESEKTRRLVEELLEEFNSFGKLNGKYEDDNE
jgi:hypothetical protein